LALPALGASLRWLLREQEDEKRGNHGYSTFEMKIGHLGE
jgi:hypothetical protein